MKSVCFTGHRTINGKYYDKEDKDWNLVKKRLREIVEFLIVKDGYKSFYTGGALGVDTLVFEILYDVNFLIAVNINLCIPTANHGDNWPEHNKEQLKTHKAYADNIINVYEDKKYIGLTIGQQLQKRNEYMVDHSDLVIAVWDGNKSGGTWNCINYAHKNKKKIIYLSTNDFKFHRYC